MFVSLKSIPVVFKSNHLQVSFLLVSQVPARPKFGHRFTRLANFFLFFDCSRVRCGFQAQEKRSERERLEL